MSNQNLSWKELQFLYRLTGEPIAMGKFPEGYCMIYDHDNWEDHGMPKNSDAILVKSARMDQRTKPVAELHPGVQKTWFTDPGIRDHGENLSGAFRIYENGRTDAIIPEPSISELKQMTENFGPLKIDTDPFTGALRIELNR